MSRIGKNPVAIPAGVTVTMADEKISVKGKLGELSAHASREVDVKVESDKVVVLRKNQTKFSHAMWGTMTVLIKNMVTGVSAGFTKKLVIEGIGLKAAASGNTLKMNLGYSHEINYEVPKGIKVATPSPTTIEVSGIDRRLVGEVAAKIRGYRPPEPYKGKGVRYEGEYVPRKQGKKK
ncbi:MAG: 50S ribosomal protein L6 [Alphaproteobacteria bacterium]|nr:50S ribosomal protein L6 [Alphaproteobacteria bacterium]